MRVRTTSSVGVLAAIPTFPLSPINATVPTQLVHYKPPLYNIQKVARLFCKRIVQFIKGFNCHLVSIG